MKNLIKVDDARLPSEEKYVAVATLVSQEMQLRGPIRCAHQLLEAQAVLTPYAPALIVKGETLSYAQLNHKANQLAHRLRLLGIGPEVLVGLCLPRTADLVIALLAILKAGGAYVPLDPAYPADRLHFQVQDAGIPLLLTVSSLEHLWQGIEVTRLHLDQLSEDNHEAWDVNPDSEVCGENLAYVIYTSGSTGRPKGVCIAHRNTLALVDWSLRHFTLDDVRGMVAGTSICFDLSIFEFFVPWSCGGTVYLVENGLHLPEGDARGQSTLLNMVPSVMAELARTTPLPPSIRVITFCGETLPRPLVERLYSLPHIERIYNLYGPTEDTTYSTWSLLDRDEHGENVPIGYPLYGSQVYLLDHDGYQVPSGEIGEIYLGGAGVTRGYWNRPDMTAQRFVPDPFSQQPGSRLYRTGDLARYRADGQLEFLGRSDQQVKIRGHRIELGEIESVLHQHADIQDCVVLARKPASGGTYLILVAYIVPVRQHDNLEEELRAFLLQRLPEYMLPTFFVSLEAFPKTSNGKINRQALPDPQAGRERKPPRSSQMKTKLTQALNLSTEKKELFKKMLKKEFTSSSDPLLPEPGKEPMSETGEECFPLSFSQQRYWLIDQLDPGTPLYNIFFASQAIGKLDIEALRRSLHEIVRRHEPLRSAFFLNADGIAMQRVCPPSTFPVPVIDLRSLSPEQRQQEEQRLLQQETKSSFDLSQGLLLRASVILSTDASSILMVNTHHISSDGWATDLFREELAAIYEAFVYGRPSPLPDLPIRYVDYVLWHEQRLQDGLQERQLSYWKQQLAHLPAPLFLPADRPRSTRQTFNGKIYCFSLPVSLLRKLRALSQSEGVTLFMTLFAGFQTLLCRLSGQEDILVGTPIAGRTRADFEKMIGCFVNTVVFRTDMQGNPSFRELLQRVRAMALAAYNNNDVSLEQVLHIVRPERDSAHTLTPLFQVMFHFQHIISNLKRDVDVNVERLPQKNMAAKFDLSLRIKVLERGENASLDGEFLYNTDLFDEATMARFAQRFQRLLEAAVAQPEQRVWELPILPEQERELLVEWNATRQELSPQKPVRYVHQLFEAQATYTPDAIAVVTQQAVLSYAQLNTRANQLAHHLRLLGVGPEILVGVCLPQTADLLVALLAILKAGGAYLALDPTSPPEQVAFLLKDAQAAVVLTQQGLLADEQSVHAVYMDTPWSSISQESTENPLHQTNGKDMAYVCYTTKSAEASKGVIIEHRQLLNYILAISERIGMAQGSSFALLQPITTDSAVTAIYSTLCTGGTLYMVSQECATNANWLKEYFQEHPIDYLTVTLFQGAESQALVEQMMPRRCLIIGGEPPAWHWMRKLKATYPACTIFNQFGPTETTVGATLYEVQLESNDGSYALTPIGKPLANTQIHILDSSLQPVPIHLPGELYISGSHVARGYLHDPALTAEKFLADPSSADPETRLYKTGALARYLSDGTIEFLGQVADRVRVHGIWVELSEIQAILSQHPAVHSLLVMVREDMPGDQQIVAYVVLREGQTTTVSDLRNYVSQYLPLHMVPSTFVFLDALPMTQHGGVDRQSLLRPDSSTERAKNDIVAHSDIEAKLVGIWESLLQTSPIAVQDNFFDLGGNSLLAVRLMARVQREFQQELPISVLFQKATPELLAAELLRRRWSGNESALVEIQPIGTKRPLFCIHPIGGEVFCYADLARQLGPEQPVYGLQVPGKSHQQACSTLEDMARSYIAEIRTIQPAGPYLLAGWSLGGVIAFEMAQQLLQQGHEVELLALLDSNAPTVRNSTKPLIEQFGEELEGIFGKKLYLDYTQLQHFTLDEQLTLLYAYAEQADILPPDMEFEQLLSMFSLYKRNIEAVRQYKPRGYAGRIILFTATQCEENKQAESTCGWQMFAEQALDVYPIPGNHYSMLKPPNLYHLAEQLKYSLDRHR
ncbi:MAG TPA: amino acid adenylation domain-containing protein [Ktedonobacteraceae bacterium]|nr:amino acid adenylation domain-containing protein [Ktedonobacteraceae bacterium]